MAGHGNHEPSPDGQGTSRRYRFSVLRAFLAHEAAGGYILMAVAALALIAANSPLADSYFALFKARLGPLSMLHWINDALMAMFFSAGRA